MVEPAFPVAVAARSSHRGARMICELLFDARQRLLVIRIGRVLSPDTLAFMQAALGRFRSAHGPCPGFLDLSETEETTVPIADLVALARHRPVMAGERRIFVAPRDEIYGLSRMVAAYQDMGGHAPAIVRTRAEAFALLGVSDAALERFEGI